MDEIERGRLALEALRTFYEIADLGDYIYDVREREGEGWEGPKVKAWSDACTKAQRALKAD